MQNPAIALTAGQSNGGVPEYRAGSGTSNSAYGLNTAISLSPSGFGIPQVSRAALSRKTQPLLSKRKKKLLINNNFRCMIGLSTLQSNSSRLGQIAISHGIQSMPILQAGGHPMGAKKVIFLCFLVILLTACSDGRGDWAYALPNDYEVGSAEKVKYLQHIRIF